MSVFTDCSCAVTLTTVYPRSFVAVHIGHHVAALARCQLGESQLRLMSGFMWDLTVIVWLLHTKSEAQSCWQLYANGAAHTACVSVRACKGTLGVTVAPSVQAHSMVHVITAAGSYWHQQDATAAARIGFLPGGSFGVTVLFSCFLWLSLLVGIRIEHGRVCCSSTGDPAAHAGRNCLWNVGSETRSSMQMAFRVWVWVWVVCIQKQQRPHLVCRIGSCSISHKPPGWTRGSHVLVHANLGKGGGRLLVCSRWCAEGLCGSLGCLHSDATKATVLSAA